jgi:NAD(P)-dependent dehydrogenase (short-subunit alcohol dehydrogenase family)
MAGMRTGQAALIIGGTGALGAAVAERLAEEGCDVAFTYRSNADAAAALTARIDAAGRRAETGSPAIEDADAIAAFVAQTVARFGRLDTLVYAAGPPFPLDFAGRIAPADWRRVMEADVGGCFNALHAALPHLRAARGAFVAITAAGIERAIARDILSLAPKAAITALVRTVALEEGRAGVRANCVAPGYIAGGIGREIMDRVGEEVAARLVNAVPLRRMGTPAEVADAVEYLSSARAAYITGTTLFVSGGMEL